MLCGSNQAVTYNAHIYLTALNAAKALAQAVGDTAALEKIQKSYTLSQAAIVDERLWNGTGNFFRCHTKDGGEGDNQIFTDSLYGQMLRYDRLPSLPLTSQKRRQKRGQRK